VLVSEFDYQLPPGRIAQRPLEQRDASRLLLLSRETGEWRDERFLALPDLLRGDELLVFNNARVIPARLFGRRQGVHAERPARATARTHLTGTVEVFLTKPIGEGRWEALVRPGRKMAVGERVLFGDGELEAKIVGRGEFGVRTVELISRNGEPIPEHIERLGHVPLPPYIERADDRSDRERYQTVFAKRSGAVAAPTAGLHFTRETLRKIAEKGVPVCEVTLHVGLGTFQPVHGENLEEHVMHEESYDISREVADAIARARAAGRKIVAIGTTVVRTLEDAAQRAVEAGGNSVVLAGPGEARIFITPGYGFRVVDSLLTNFHLPRSTLLALACAFAGREKMLAAYRHAVEAGYRFYSYGDCMLIR
jgi:S-adenosylmethionine:tRNA ribosyltransferase-isomerase